MLFVHVKKEGVKNAKITLSTKRVLGWRYNAIW